MLRTCFCAAVLGVTQDPAANITSLLSCAVDFCTPSKTYQHTLQYLLLGTVHVSSFHFRFREPTLKVNLRKPPSRIYVWKLC